MTANVEMLSQAPGPICAAAGQTPELSSLSFSYSLLAASEASSTPVVGNDGSPKAESKQQSAFDVAKTSMADSDLRAVQPSILPPQAALSQQLLRAKQTLLTNPIVTPRQLSVGDPASTPGVATELSDQPMANGAASKLATTESTMTQAGVIKSVMIQPTKSLPGAGPVQTTSILPGAKTQETKGPIAFSSNARNNASKAVVSGASKSVRKPVQNAEPSASPSEVQDSLLASFLYAQPSAVPNAPTDPSLNAIPGAAPAALADELQRSFPKAVLSGPSSAVPNDFPAAVSNAIQNLAPSTAPDEVQNPLPKELLDTQSSAAPNVPSKEVPKAVSNAAPTTTGPNEAQNSFPEIVLSAPQDSAPIVPSKERLNTVQSAIPNAVPNEVQNPLAKPVLSALPIAAPSVPSNAAPSAVQGATPNAAPNEVQNRLPKAVRSLPPSAVPYDLLNTGPDPVPVPHATSNASAMADIVLAASRVSTDHTALSSAAPDQSVIATGFSASSSTANQFVALTQLISGLMGTGRTGVSTLNPAAAPNAVVATGGIDKGGIKDAPSNSAGLKQHTQSAADLAGFQADSQAATSSGDQSQNSSSSQGQNAAPAPMSVANHSVAAMADTQSRANPSPIQIVPIVAGVAGHVAMAPNNTSHISTAVPQTLPAINTAKLIQSMGQSEMRVGMRTDEFGNISIRTSATRGLISAQISLDHTELARTLATHLPEMQTRLGSNQAMDVRIEMNREGSGQGAGMTGGMSNGSADQSRDGRQQAGNAASSYSANSVAQRLSFTSAALASGDGRLNARLDIRV